MQWTPVPNLPVCDPRRVVRRADTPGRIFTLLLIGPQDDTDVPAQELRDLITILHDTALGLETLLP